MLTPLRVYAVLATIFRHTTTVRLSFRQHGYYWLCWFLGMRSQIFHSGQADEYGCCPIIFCFQQFCYCFIKRRV